jgi:CheY-like chemotaxis protein
MWMKLKTILLVDDDPITNFINLRLIKKMDIVDEVTAVTNGEEGLKCLEGRCFKERISPDLILLDINMPIMNGFEFLEAYNSLQFKNKEKVVIAILTTSALSKDKKKMENLGIKYFVDKPLTEDKIRACLHSHNFVNFGKVIS